MNDPERNEEPEQPEPWDPATPPEVFEMLSLVGEVIDAGGNETELVTRLVAAYGDGEALRRLALIEVMQARTTRSRIASEIAYDDLRSWEDRRCPTCGTICSNCVGEQDGEIRHAFGDLDA